MEDAAEAIVMATQWYDSPEAVNIGAGFEVSIRDLVREIMTLTRYAGDVTWDVTKPNGQPRRCLDVSRATALFGFEARMSLREGLRRTIEWYEKILSLPAPRHQA